MKLIEKNVSNKLFALAVAFVGLTGSAEAQNIDLRTTEDVILFVATKKAGVEMPSQEAMKAFSVSEDDRLALAIVIENGTVDLSEKDQRRVFLRSIRPAMNFVTIMNQEAATDVELISSDLAELRAKMYLAYEIINAVGTTSTFNRLCQIVVSVQNESVANRVSAPSIEKIAAPCRPDANDKICAPSGDVLVSDTCATSTSKYCALVRVTGGGGVMQCNVSSDRP